MMSVTNYHLCYSSFSVISLQYYLSINTNSFKCIISMNQNRIATTAQTISLPLPPPKTSLSFTPSHHPPPPFITSSEDDTSTSHPDSQAAPQSRAEIGPLRKWRTLPERKRPLVTISPPSFHGDPLWPLVRQKRPWCIVLCYYPPSLKKDSFHTPHQRIDRAF